MSDVIKLAQERTGLFNDLWQGRIPKRVPVVAMIQVEFAIQYAGRDLFKEQWDTTDLENVFDKVCQDFYSDLMPVSAVRFPSYYKLLGARNFVMSSQGFLQHPEIVGLEVEDYEAIIASPYDCIVERVLPRLYSELDTEPGKRSIAMAKAFKAYQDEGANQLRAIINLMHKYGYGGANFFTGMCEAPFDILTDQLRGFKNIVADVRRYPDKVEAAVEALTPLMIRMGTPAFPMELGAVFIPLHMAPYLRDKDFAKFYWPSFKNLVQGLADKGHKSFIFAEQDWSRYVDYLAELPEKTIINFEYGDPKVIKEKLGDKHIITGFYPLSLLKTGTKQQCIDKAKELIDILAPGGNYFFSFDKAVITTDSVDVENFQAVLEYVSTIKY